MTCLPTSFPHWEKITPGDNNSRALPHLPLLSQESCNTQKKLLGREIQVLTQEAVTVDEICASKFRRPWGVQKVKGQSLMVSDLPLSSVQSLSHVQLFATPWTAARQASCPLPSPRACSNSCPLGQWCHPTISSSVVPFSSCLQSFPASGSFPVSQFFASGG